ncbi:unnamed protein product [Urochloa humidicola]
MARTGGRGGLAAGDSQAARPSTSTGRRDLKKAFFVSAEVSGGTAALDSTVHARKSLFYAPRKVSSCKGQVLINWAPFPSRPDLTHSQRTVPHPTGHGVS